MLRGNDFNKAYNTMEDAIIPSIKACWTMWIPLQFVNFAFVKSNMRPTVVNIGCFIWNIAIDHISNDYISHSSDCK